MKNVLGRELPSSIEGYGEVIPFEGAFERAGEKKKATVNIKSVTPMDEKLVNSIEEVLDKVNIKDGMTISFHHHLRNGDYILNMVMDEIASIGIKDITICASSLTGAHEPLLDHINNGVVTGLQTSGLRGKLGQEVSLNNILGKPVIFRTHGGRARAIESGEVKIDVAFIAAPACDPMGNMNETS